MDESFLTREPFLLSKTPGSEVISGAINGESALTIRATRPAADSRYASRPRSAPHRRSVPEPLNGARFCTAAAIKSSKLSRS